MALARVSGAVLNVDSRSGISKRTNEPYRMTFVRVLVEERDITEVQIPDAVRPPHRGDAVDWLVEFGTYNGNLYARWNADHPDAAMSSVA